ncbi:Trehalose-6-P synthase/phosphatase complex subunit [Stygiomarasmius scandens]|uniref:Trehalose-6-P synthase/phosphatase complex subunit n=1 Tax=Marasmiellus scandens TaxID=2682957 RepID=A0ABR1JD58_9AGAR
MSTSSSIRNHRILIAALFLPNTVVLGPEEPDYYQYFQPSPQPQQQQQQEEGISVPDVVLRLEQSKKKGDKNGEGTVVSQASSAHPHLPSSALGTPATPPTTAGTPGSITTSTSGSTSSGTTAPTVGVAGTTVAAITPGVESIVQDLKNRTKARKSGGAVASLGSVGSVGGSVGETPLRSPTLEMVNPFSKPASKQTSVGGSGVGTPAPTGKDAKPHHPHVHIAHTHHSAYHRSPLSRMGSSHNVTSPSTTSTTSAAASPSVPGAHPPLPLNMHRTLSRRTFRRQSSVSSNSTGTATSPPLSAVARNRSKSKSRSKRRTPGVGSTASMGSISSIGSLGSVSAAGAEGLDTHSYPSGEDLSASVSSVLSASTSDGHTDEGFHEHDHEEHALADALEEDEEEEDEDLFHIEPNPHCNGGLKNAVDSVSAFGSGSGGSLSPGAYTFGKTTMGSHGVMGGSSPGTGSGMTSPGGRASTYPMVMSPGGMGSPASPGAQSPGGHGRRTRTGAGMSISTDLRDKPLRQKLWIGTLGTRTDGWSDSLKEKVTSDLINTHSNLPVFLPDTTFEGAYDEFCHQVLWPTLHYAIPDAPRTKLLFLSSTTSKAYRDYVEVNRKVAERIREVWREGDVVWVNDYHLMLVPRMLRALGITGPIGFFLHVSFPSSEIIRCLPVRVPLLRGILGADLVGFQTANFARHFRQTCGRVLGVEALPRGVVVSEDLDGDLDLDEEERVTLAGGGKVHPKVESESDSDDALAPRKDPYYVPPSLSGPSTSLDNGSGLTRFVTVGVFPMGIDVNRLKERRKSPEVEEWVEVLKSRYKSGDKNQKVKLVVGRDKLDDIQGVRQKVQAFELFLEKYPEWVGKVVLIQIALPAPPPPATSSDSEKPKSSAHLSHLSTLSNDSSASTAASTDSTSAILSKVAQINSKWSSLTYQPVIFLHTAEVDWNQYLALLSVADAFLVTSLREGMALRTHEFVAVQEGRGKHSNGKGENVGAEEESDQEGTLVLSEFTGSYSYSGFRSCIAINPWDTRGTAEAIHQALTMGKEEARGRWEELSEHVETQTAQAFVRSFLGRCIRAAEENRGLGKGAKGKRRHHHDDEDDDDERKEVEEVDPRKLKVKWRHARRRLVLVDWEGTLIGDWMPIPRELEVQQGRRGSIGAASVVSRDSGVETEMVDEEARERVERGLEEKERRREEELQRAIEVLKKLAVDTKKNEVWLLSGLPVKGVLERVDKELGGKIGIVAENGCFIKTRSVNTSSRGGFEQQQQTQQGSTQWLNMVANLNMTWKSACLEILNYFTERTPGSFVEERAASVVWRFWTGPTDDSADRQWARRQAAEAQNHIFDSLGERYGLRIIPGTNSFLVLPNNISRSSAVGAILHPGGPAHSPLVGRAAWMGPEVDSVPVVPEEWDFVLAMSGDEKLLRRLGELDQAETVTISTSGKGTDAKWKMGRGRAGEVLSELANA